MSSETKKKPTKTSSQTKKTAQKSKSLKGNAIITQLKKDLSDFEEKHLRLKAEFENFRRRKEKEISKLLEYEGLEIFTQLLPLFDDLARMNDAFESTSKDVDDSLKKGLQMINTKVEKFLSEFKLEAFGKPGENLDAELHDALMIRSEKGKGDDEILEVFEKGYRYKDRVIRHAKVVVNKS